jgi:hypothetical protein
LPIPADWSKRVEEFVKPSEVMRAHLVPPNPEGQVHSGKSSFRWGLSCWTKQRCPGFVEQSSVAQSWKYNTNENISPISYF